MANTIDSNLLVDIISEQVITTAQAKLFPLNAVSFVYSSAPNAPGATVQVPLVDAGSTVNQFNGTFANDAVAFTSTSVSLSALYTSFSISDYDIAVTGMKGIQAIVDSKVKSLASTIVQNALNTAISSSTSAIAVSTSNFDGDSLGDIRTVMSVANVSEPSLILAPAFYTAALADLAATESFNFAEASREGKITRARGFNVYEANMFASNVGGLALGKGGLAVALNYWAPMDGAYEIAQPITDKDSGLTFGLRMWNDPATGAKRVVITALAGVAAGLTAQLKKIVKLG